MLGSLRQEYRVVEGGRVDDEDTNVENLQTGFT